MRPGGGLAAFLVTLSLALSAGAAESILVANPESGRIQIVELEAGAAARAFSPGVVPQRLALDRRGGLLYVAGPGGAVAIRLDDFRTVGRFPGAEIFGGMALHPDGRQLFISGGSEAAVAAFDAESGEELWSTPLDQEPGAVAVATGGDWLAVTSRTTGVVHLIDTETFQSVAWPVVGPRPGRLVWSGGGSGVGRLYLTDAIDAAITVIDGDSQETVARIPIFIKGLHRDLVQPKDLVIAGQRIFVALGPARRIAVVEAESLSVIRLLNIGVPVDRLALGLDGARLYALSSAAGVLVVIDTEFLQEVRRIDIEAGATDLAVITTVAPAMEAAEEDSPDS